MDARWRAWWLLPLLLGAGGPRGGAAPMGRDAGDPMGNICLVADLVGVGKFTAARFTKDYQDTRVSVTEADLLLEYVLFTRDAAHRPGELITYLTLGGRSPSGDVSQSSFLNHPDVGDWFLLASFQEEDRIHPTIVAYQKLPELSHARVEAASLQSAYADLCARHPEGIYQSDFLEPGMRGELQRVMGRLSPGVQTSNVGAGATGFSTLRLEEKEN